MSVLRALMSHTSHTNNIIHNKGYYDEEINIPPNNVRRVTIVPKRFCVRSKNKIIKTTFVSNPQDWEMNKPRGALT